MGVFGPPSPRGQTRASQRPCPRQLTQPVTVWCFLLPFVEASRKKAPAGICVGVNTWRSTACVDWLHIWMFSTVAMFNLYLHSGRLQSVGEGSWNITHSLAHAAQGKDSQKTKTSCWQRVTSLFSQSSLECHQSIQGSMFADNQLRSRKV